MEILALRDMAAQKRPESKINLLPQKGFGTTTTGRILAWILSTFRIIVIVTEIIVMVAFLSRFWLDAQNTDLAEEIQQKQAVLAASLTFDKEFKDTQKRLQLYTDSTKDLGTFTKNINSIKSFLPPDILVTSITFSGDTMSIDGLSPSESSIDQFIENLRSTDLFMDLAPYEIKTSLTDPTLLQFTLTADLKGGGS